MPDVHIPALAQTRIVKHARIRRERNLPTRGQVMVANGSRVGSLDVVAKTDGGGRLRPVPLARYLHVKENEIEKFLLKKPGETINARDVIASKPELFGTLRRIYRAPGNGRIVGLRGAWLTMELADAPFELRALYRGSVVNVNARVGVTIEANGALVQGIWGAGGESYGVLKKMVDAPDMILTEDKIDLSARGVILIAGAGVTAETIRRAAQEHAAGLIVGSLLPNLRELVTTLALPTLVTEGFGERAMSALVFDLLTAHNGNEAILNTFGNARGAPRSEVFIPVLLTGGESALPPPTLVAEVGATVRIVGGARAGEIGTIANVSETPRTLESGALAWGAEIAIGASSVFVPWDNLELIG